MSGDQKDPRLITLEELEARANDPSVWLGKMCESDKFLADMAGGEA